MPTLRIQAPRPSAASPLVGGAGSIEEAVDRAFEAAGGVTDESAVATCGFRQLGPRAVSLLRPLHPPEGRAQGWAIVTACDARDDRQRAHCRERCLTAAQRFMLSLSCDGVSNGWIDTELPDADAFCSAGVDLGSDVPVGLIWWGPE